MENKKTATEWATEHAQDCFDGKPEYDRYENPRAALESMTSAYQPFPSEVLLAREGYAWYLKHGAGTIYENRWFREYDVAFIRALTRLVGS